MNFGEIKFRKLIYLNDAFHRRATGAPTNVIIVRSYFNITTDYYPQPFPWRFDTVHREWKMAKSRCQNCQGQSHDNFPDKNWDIERSVCNSSATHSARAAATCAPWRWRGRGRGCPPCTPPPRPRPPPRARWWWSWSRCRPAPAPGPPPCRPAPPPRWSPCGTAAGRPSTTRSCGWAERLAPGCADIMDMCR